MKGYITVLILCSLVIFSSLLHALVFFLNIHDYMLWMFFLPILWFVIFFLRYKDLNSVVFLFVFPIVSYIYLNMPLLSLSLGVNVYNFSYQNVLLISKILSFLSGLMFLSFYVFVRKKYIDAFFERTRKSIKNTDQTKLGNILFSSVGLLLVIIYDYMFLTNGILEKIGNSSRLELANAMETGKVWLLQYIISAWVMSYIYLYTNFSKSKILFAINISVVILFLYPLLLVGSRREIVGIFLFFVVVSGFLGITKKWLPLILTLFISLLFLGYSRSLNGVENIDFQFKFISSFGEFLLPHMSLLYFVDSNVDYILGSSIYSFPLTLIPSMELWDKPITLAREFALTYANGEIGYAFTPYSESYLNFGYLGLLLFPVFFGLLFSNLLRIRQLSLLAVIIVSFSFDINRGEFSSVITQLLIYLLMLFFFKRVSRAK